MKTTVYRYYNADNELLYVGITKNQLNRFEAHSKVQPWFHEITKAFFQHTDTREEALEYEKYIIANEFPKYNKAGPVLPENLLEHLQSIIAGEFDDEFHSKLHAEMTLIIHEIDGFSTTADAYKVCFAFDRGIPWTESGEHRLTDCYNCQNVIDSKWFKATIEDAENIICDEASAK